MSRPPIYSKTMDTKVMLRLDSELKKQFELEAKKRGMTLTYWMRFVLETASRKSWP
jgi:predicted HicB family RNase H-like nuclease